MTDEKDPKSNYQFSITSDDSSITIEDCECWGFPFRDYLGPPSQNIIIDHCTIEIVGISNDLATQADTSGLTGHSGIIDGEPDV
jgi:hypothetical protein